MTDPLYLLVLCLLLLSGISIGGITRSKKAWALLTTSFLVKSCLAILVTVEPIFGTGDIGDYRRHLDSYVRAAGLIDYLSPLPSGPQLYVALYPGLLYESFGDRSFLLIRLINAFWAVVAEATLYFLVQRVTKTNTNLAIFTIAFMWPSWLRYSIELGRTSISVFSVLASMLFIVLLFQKKEKVLSLLFLMFCAGLCLLLRPPYIIMPLIFLLAYRFFSLRKRTLLQRIQNNSLYIFFASILAASVITLYNKFTRPLQRAELSVIMERSQRDLEAGSAYLTNLSLDTLLDMILYGPLLGFMFMFSPMPWQAQPNPFVIGSILQAQLVLFLLLAAWYTFVFGKSKYPPIFHYTSFLSIIITFFGSAFILGLGVKVAGAAERYRMPLTLTILPFALHIVTQYSRFRFKKPKHKA